MPGKLRGLKRGPRPGDRGLDTLAERLGYADRQGIERPARRPLRYGVTQDGPGEEYVSYSGGSIERLPSG